MAFRPLVLAVLGLLVSGSVSAQPIGPAAPTPVPIGGLRTRPLDAPASHGDLGVRQSRPPGDAGHRGSYDGRPSSRRFGDGYGYGFRDGYRYGMTDAPLPRGVSVRIVPRVSRPVSTLTWLPTGDRPRWRVDSSLTRVQAWRDLLVNDVVCDGVGTCMERERRIRAPWVPVCRCYLFTDALGRRWEVADR